MDTKSGIYSFQLDGLWFTLDADLLHSALGITLKDSTHPFVAPPAGDLTQHTQKPQSPLHITANDYSLSNLKFIPKGELDEVFRMVIPKDLITDVIRNSEYYQKYLDMVARKPLQATNVIDEEGGKKKSPSADKEPQPVSEPQVKDDDYNLQRGIQMSLESFQEPVDEVASHEPDSGITQKLLVVEGKGKCFASDELAAQSLLDLQNSKKKNAKTGANTEKSTSKENTKIFNDDEDHGEEVSHSGSRGKNYQAGSNPGQSHVVQAGPNPEPIYEVFVATVYPQVHESLKLTTKEHVYIENPPSSSRTLSLMKNLDDAFTFEKICANFEKKNKLQDKTTQAFPSRVYTLENHDLYSKIYKYINEVVKEAVHNALQAPIRKRFRDLSGFEMKEILRDWMFKSGSYRSYPEHTTLYEALEAYMNRENMDEFNEEMAKSPSKQPLIQKSSAWKTFDTREAPSSSSKRKHASPSEQSIDDVPIPDDMEEYHLLLTYQIDLLNPEGVKERRNALSISKLKVAYYPDFELEELIPSLWIKSECDYDISAAYGISHCLKTFFRYCYTYLKEIVLHKADYKEYKILEADFINLHPNDFEDLYLLHLQGKLNHLSVADKVPLFNAVNLWIRSIVIRQRVEDLGRNSQKKKMRETKVHKFSDGTLTRILEKLDVMVKDYVLFKFNPGMEHRIWSEDDKRRSQEFIKLIERWLMIRCIFRSLKSIVSGRLRDVDYRLIQRT
uniref:Histone deacetylase 14 n=1 Tax=Tanacetum cinerariifolium TaxID=118510 RepID=A0A699HKY0_TANCI|nr:hypothetical protein [Tanacetum cinerariifolium]